MLPQHSLSRESLLADVALERLLAGVGPHVVGQPGRPGESSPADVAGELQRGVEEPFVLLQLLGGGEISLAEEAVKSLILRMKGV